VKLFYALLLAPALFAQQPRITNANVETRSGAGLQASFQSILTAQDAPAWVAYTIPSSSRNNENCCWSDNSRGCALEGGKPAANLNAGPVMLEGSSTMVVLYRVAAHAVTKTRMVSSDCGLDGGGLPFLFLTGVRPAESVALLESMVTEKNDHPIAIIALHADPAAEQALERLSNSSQPERVREKTLFWLGSSPNHNAYLLLKRIATQDSSDTIRDKSMFALSVSKDPDAVNTLIESAKNDKSPRVRSQALFWLAHKAGQKEAQAISAAVENDPDVAVKKKAVFALSQLPKDEGVPLLIQLARTNKTPEVRKQAMFWLGQSKDPRAVAFFQEVLTK
jgi:HEAT repeat protein